MRIAVAAALAVLSAACSPKEAPKPAASASPIPPAPGPTCAGETLPITKLCGDAQPALFGYLNADAALYAPTCKWVTAEVRRSETEVLLFRTQKCPADVDKLMGYRFAGDVLTAQYAHPEAGKPPYDRPVAEFFALADGKDAETVALARVASSSPKDAKRCIIKPAPENKTVAGQAFGVEPDAAYMAELNKKHPDEPFDACGPYGFTNDGVAFWEKRPGLAIWHMIGQEAPAWDPASFTVYVRDTVGMWVRPPSVQTDAPPSPKDSPTPGPVVGGYAPADPESAEVKAALKLATDELYKRFPQRAIVEKTKADMQIVAGLNYRFELTMSGGKRYSAVVYKPLQGQMSVTSLDEVK